MVSFFGTSCNSENTPPADIPEPAEKLEQTDTQTIVLAGGCFWCVEGVFERLKGVSDVESGYAGGREETANYQAVASGQTDHAEVVRITYDPAEISYEQLLKVFFTVAHDPTQRNRQGPDVGRQYRSAIFYTRDEEKRVAEAYIKQLDEAGVFQSPIVTTLEPLEAYYPAEAYHQDYVQNNPTAGYVQFQAMPKIQKLEQTYPQKLRSDESLP